MFGFGFQRGFTCELRMKEGQEWLAEYLRTGSEAAFREVVDRYLNFVYSVALRLVGGDSLLAEDVAQTVFINLAKKAGGFSSAVSLGGWLHEHTFHVATKAVRSEKRRQAREQEAVRMSTLQDNDGLGMAQVGPTLHEAIRQLGEEDRAAILLRFFEQRDFRAVGQVLGSTEDAARMRVNRALEKLHGLLNKQGIALSASALAAGLATEAVTAAPAGLASTIAGTALASAVTSGTALTAFKLMTVTKMKLAFIGTLAAAAIAAPVIVQHQSVSRLREENRILQEQQSKVAQLASENERLTNLVAQANRAPALEQDQVHELLRLRGEVASLRQQNKELEQLKQENRELRMRPATVPPQAPATRQQALTADDAARNACINHLRQIDGAIQTCALENKLSENDSVTAQQIIPYLKNPDAVLSCPSGGTYTFGPVTNVPLCSVPGHAIPGLLKDNQ